ncbi:MAG: galactokinase, partial [Bacteroidetes bacterium]|nr:galactokinase [Bacteroidota bacterium]
MADNPILSLVRSQFAEHYAERPAKASVFFAPGRVNLIGEHTDYNGGYVFPCALDYGTYLVVRQTEEPLLCFSSGNKEETFSISLETPFSAVAGAWVNFPLGVFDQFVKKGHRFPGMEMHFLGDIPEGAGLSSSASIEMVT